MSSTIQWLNAFEFDDAIQRSDKVDKPVLLDFHDASSESHQEMEKAVYSTKAVVKAIVDHAIPVRIETTGLDPVSTGIINCYISISTASIQLLSSRRTVYHYFRGSPRLTVLCARQIAQGARRVYRESAGHLSAEQFLAQFSLGLGKRAFLLGQFVFADQWFEAVAGECRDEEAAREARFWQSAVRSRTASPGATLSEADIACPCSQ